jgi:hypothetical protein
MSQKRAANTHEPRCIQASAGLRLRLGEAICDVGRFDASSHPLGLRGRNRSMISDYGRRRFSHASILDFRATVTPRLSGSVTLSRWSHRFSIFVESMSCRKKDPSASDRLL